MESIVLNRAIERVAAARSGGTDFHPGPRHTSCSIVDWDVKPEPKQLHVYGRPWELQLNKAAFPEQQEEYVALRTETTK